MKLVEHLRTWDQIPDDDEEAFHWLNLKTAEAADLIEKQAAELAAARYADSILKSELRASQATSSFKEARRMQVAVLQEQLADEQAKNVGLREVLEYWTPFIESEQDDERQAPWVVRAQEALAIQPDTSALKAWLGQPVSYLYKHYSAFGDGEFWSHRQNHNGVTAVESKALYSPKELK